MAQSRTIFANRRKHNAGEVPHTSKFKPWRIQTAIAFDSKDKAFAFERYLKSANLRKVIFDIQPSNNYIVEVVEIALPASRTKPQMLWDNLRSLSFCLLQQGFGQLRIRVGNLSDLLEVNTVFHCYPLASKVVLGQAIIR